MRWVVSLLTGYKVSKWYQYMITMHTSWLSKIYNGPRSFTNITQRKLKQRTTNPNQIIGGELRYCRKTFGSCFTSTTLYFDHRQRLVNSHNQVGRFS